MRNRAKCKLCQAIVESFINNEYVTCKCGQLSVMDGPAMRMEFVDENNVLRLDDEGNEYPIKYQHQSHEKKEKDETSIGAHKLTKDELIAELDSLIKIYNNLPDHAMEQPVTHADHQSLLMILSSIFKAS